MAGLITCSVCKMPKMEDWDSCPYCVALSKGTSTLPKKKRFAFGDRSMSLLVAVICLIVLGASGYAFVGMENEEDKQSRIAKEKRVAEIEARDYTLSEKNINLLRASDLKCAKDFLIVYDSGLSYSKEANRALLNVGAFIVKHSMVFDNLSKVEKIVVHNGLENFKQNMPRGSYVLNRNEYGGECPIEVSTQGGSGGYVIKIEKVPSGYELLKAFIPAGSTYATNIPDGVYCIKYIHGENWYGDDIMFGYQCAASKADKNFTFFNGNGYSIKLYSVRNGNLQTSKIRLGDF